MSNVEDINLLEDTSPQSSWIFVDDCDVDTAQNKYYLNCSAEPVTELTEPVEKKDPESDSDSISIISESDDGKETASENKESTENGLIVKKEDAVEEDSLKILYSRLYAFGCLLLAVVLPILLNYVMHNSNNNPPPTYLKDYQSLPEELSDHFLETLSDDVNEEGSTEPSYTESELVNVNIVPVEEIHLYNQAKEKPYSKMGEVKNKNEIKEYIEIEQEQLCTDPEDLIYIWPKEKSSPKKTKAKNFNGLNNKDEREIRDHIYNQYYEVGVNSIYQIEEPSIYDMYLEIDLNRKPTTERQDYKTDSKYKPTEPKTKSYSKGDKIKTEDYKTKIKDKSEKSERYSRESKQYKKHKKSDTDNKNFKKEKESFEYKKGKNIHRETKHTDSACGKELSKLKRVIVNQEKHIRNLNKSLKDRQRQIRIIQNKIFQEIKELKHLQYENNKYKHNFTHLVSGEWYDSYFDHRDKIRKRQHAADWYFDRAHYRQKKRIPEKNWYINWMSQREDHRKHTDWHFSF